VPLRKGGRAGETEREREKGGGKGLGEEEEKGGKIGSISLKEHNFRYIPSKEYIIDIYY